MTNNDFTRSVMSRLLLGEQEQYQQALDKFFADWDYYYQTEDTSRIWASWEKNMDFIQKGFIFAGRRILLRWLYNRVSDEKWLASHSKKALAKKLSVQSSPEAVIYRPKKDEQYIFYTNMESAFAMGKGEDNTDDVCCALIRDLVSNGDNRRADLSLIKDAFRANKSHPLVSKKDAFKLGHLLDFDFEEMEEFLAKVIQEGVQWNEQDESCCDQFNFKSSSDLIELFCFRFRDLHLNPETLRKEYEQRTNTTEKKADSKDAAGITMEIASYLIDEEEVPDWLNPEESMETETRTEQFLKWLEENAPYLDVPSQSATELARLLARKILQIINQSQELSLSFPALDNYPLTKYDAPTTLTSVPAIVVAEHEDKILTKEKWNNAHWTALSEYLRSILYSLESNTLSRNNISSDNDPHAVTFSERRNRREIDSSSLYSFFVPRKEEKSKDAPIGGPTKLQKTYNRLNGILTGEIAPQKFDILFLLFVIANLIWLDSSWPAEEVPAMVSQFEAAAEELLNGYCSNSSSNRDYSFSTIGRYYVGHYTEFTILSSIVYSAVTDHYFLPLCCYLQLLISNDKS